MSLDYSSQHQKLYNSFETLRFTSSISHFPPTQVTRTTEAIGLATLTEVELERSGELLVAGSDSRLETDLERIIFG